MGFEKQMNAITETLRLDCQKMLFSATFPLRLRKAAERWTNKDATTTVSNDNFFFTENVNELHVRICYEQFRLESDLFLSPRLH